MPAFGELYPRLTKELISLLAGLPEQAADALEEIRIYRGRRAELLVGGRSVHTDLLMDDRQMDRLLAALSGHALYRCERQMAQGYIPLPGGHRAGVCGSMTKSDDGTWRMSEVHSVCLRIARRVDGASARIRGFLLDAEGAAHSVLLMGAPGCGKTTVLRDAAVYLSGLLRVAVADEREELFAPKESKQEAQRLDVLRGMDKSQAFSMLIRSMAPQVMVCDELGSFSDADALLDAARCGVRVLASAHADGLHDLLARPVLRAVFDAGIFERYVHLGYHGSVKAVWDRTGRRVLEKEAEHRDGLGNGDGGDDWRQQSGLRFVRR